MITVIICTHNRADLLVHCLNSFSRQTILPSGFELLVVDNASVDETKKVVEEFQRTITNLKYVFEPVVGLSQARNTGYCVAANEWVAYVDDDAKAHPDFVQRCINVIDNFGFPCFGGRFLPWYITPKPKWLSDDFGAFPKLRADIGAVEGNNCVPGGIMVFRKSVLEEVNGFPANLGMAGSSVGYGEENWVQNKLRTKGYVIGFDPDLKIDHLVADYKYTVRWHVQRQLAKGHAQQILQPSAGSRISKIVYASIVTIKELIVKFPLLMKPGYYAQNYFLDSFGYLFRTLGQFKQ